MKNIYSGPGNSFKLKRTNSNDQDFKSLIVLLDNDLHKINGELMLIYSQHNIIDPIETVVIAYMDDAPVGCGCFKKFAIDTVEIKRMFVIENQRGKGIASAILTELELWAAEIGYTQTILETGKRHHEALGLYKRFGYAVIEKYEPYVDIEESICMGKKLVIS